MSDSTNGVIVDFHCHSVLLLPYVSVVLITVLFHVLDPLEWYSTFWYSCHLLVHLFVPIPCSVVSCSPSILAVQTQLAILNVSYVGKDCSIGLDDIG
jgi:hypothetical protein